MRGAGRALVGLVMMFVHMTAAAAPVPPPDHQLTLRRELAKRDARIEVEGWRYEIGRARIDSTGVWFDAANVRGVSKWKNGEKLPPTLTLSPPVAWRDVHSLETEHSGAGVGALIGGIVLPIGAAAVLGPSDSGEWAGVVSLACIPIGLLLGAAVGGLATNWQRVWPPPHVAAD
jgi:hypothetical protein